MKKKLIKIPGPLLSLLLHFLGDCYLTKWICSNKSFHLSKLDNTQNSSKSLKVSEKNMLTVAALDSPPPRALKHLLLW